MLGNGPSPLWSGPWHDAQAIVFPLPPLVTSASPFAKLPTST